MLGLWLKIQQQWNNNSLRHVCSCKWYYLNIIAILVILNTSALLVAYFCIWKAPQSITSYVDTFGLLFISIVYDLFAVEVLWSLPNEPEYLSHIIILRVNDSNVKTPSVQQLDTYLYKYGGRRGRLGRLGYIS